MFARDVFASKNRGKMDHFIFVSSSIFQCTKEVKSRQILKSQQKPVDSGVYSDFTRCCCIGTTRVGTLTSRCEKSGRGPPQM